MLYEIWDQHLRVWIRNAVHCTSHLRIIQFKSLHSLLASRFSIGDSSKRDNWVIKNRENDALFLVPFTVFCCLLTLDSGLWTGRLKTDKLPRKRIDCDPLKPEAPASTWPIAKELGGIFLALLWTRQSIQLLIVNDKWLVKNYGSCVSFAVIIW